MQDNSVEEFEVSGGFFHKIRGIINKPKGAGPFPVVFLIHGLTVNSTEYQNSLYDGLCRGILNQGSVVVRFNFSIKDLERKDENNINVVKEFHIESEKHDLRKVINYFHDAKFKGAYAYMDLDKICLAGHSYGGTILLLSADEELKGVKTLAFLSTRVTLGDKYIAMEELEKKKKQKELESYEMWHHEAQSKDSFEFNDARIHRKFLDQNFENSKKLLEIPKRIHLPSIIIIGTNDAENISDSTFLKNNIASKTKLIYITGANHSFNTGREKAGEYIAAWLKENS